MPAYSTQRARPRRFAPGRGSCSPARSLAGRRDSAKGRRLLATRVTAAAGRALAAVLVLGGAGASLWQQTARWLPQVVLGLFLWQAATQGERSAVRQELLAGRAERG